VPKRTRRRTFRMRTLSCKRLWSIWIPLISRCPSWQWTCSSSRSLRKGKLNSFPTRVCRYSRTLGMSTARNPLGLARSTIYLGPAMYSGRTILT
jgi:hypothetical protein